MASSTARPNPGSPVVMGMAEGGGSPGDQLDLHLAQLFDNPQDLADWPITTTLSVIEFGDDVHVEFSKQDGPDRWPDITPPGWDGPLQYTLGIAERINGQWVASAAIQFWYGLPASGGNLARDYQVACNWFYDGRWGALEKRQPAPGEMIGIFVVAGNVRGVTDGSQSPVKERSNVVLVPMPTEAGAKHTFLPLVPPAIRRRRHGPAPCLICVLAALTARPSAAQPASTLAVGVLVGARSVRDDTLVPLASTGPALDLSTRLLAEVGPGLLVTELRAGITAAFDRHAYPAAGVNHAMRVGYLPFVLRREGGVDLAVGALLGWETHAFWFARWDDAHLYWMGRRHASLAARGHLRTAATSRLSLSGELLLFGLESRPPAYRYNKQDALKHVDLYFAGANVDARAGTLVDFQSARLSVDYSRIDAQSGRPVGWGFGVEAGALHTSRPMSAFVVEVLMRFERSWSTP